jgi:hypothetical protein
MSGWSGPEPDPAPPVITVPSGSTMVVPSDTNVAFPDPSCGVSTRFIGGDVFADIWSFVPGAALAFASIMGVPTIVGIDRMFAGAPDAVIPGMLATPTPTRLSGAVRLNDSPLSGNKTGKVSKSAAATAASSVTADSKTHNMVRTNFSFTQIPSFKTLNSM